MKLNFSIALIVCLLCSVLANNGLAADGKTSSSALRSDLIYTFGLIDGPRVEGGATLGLYLNPDTILEAAYLEEKNLCIGDARSSEYNSKSKSFDLGVKRFLGNSLFTSLAVRKMKTESTNNDYVSPQILLWHNDIMGRVAIGNQWQLIEGMTIGVEWLSLGSTVRRIDQSSEVQGARAADKAQAVRDEKRANRFFYSTLNLQVGYSF